MKILLTGATGLVGRHLLPELLAAGVEVRCFLRPGREKALAQPDLTPFDASRVEVVHGDLRDIDERSDEYVGHVKGCDAVVHLAALPPTSPKEEMNQINIYGTRGLISATKKTHKTKRFLHFSSAECTDSLIYNEFRDSKKASEKPVRGSNLEWTVFRPAPIYGPGDQRFLGPILRKIEAGDKFDVPGDGKIRIAPVHAGDVAKAIVACLHYGMAVDAVYHLAGPGIAYDDFLNACAAMTGKPAKIQHGSIALKERWLSVQDLLTSNAQKKLEISARRNDLRFFLKDHVYPTQDSCEQLKFAPRPFPEGVRQACASPWWRTGT